MADKPAKVRVIRKSTKWLLDPPALLFCGQIFRAKDESVDVILRQGRVDDRESIERMFNKDVFTRYSIIMTKIPSIRTRESFVENYLQGF